MTNKKTPASLFIYPFENINVGTTLIGGLYAGEERYDVACGPRTASKDPGGALAEPTAAGTYILGPRQAHRSLSGKWPASYVPWGAPIREQDGLIQYQIGNRWETASGPSGKITQLVRQLLLRAKVEWSPQQIEAEVRSYFIDPVTKRLALTYCRNDFGRDSWLLIRKNKDKEYGETDRFFIHTTPDDEYATRIGVTVWLGQSHGCVHVKPSDRDKLIAAGFLKQGSIVEIMKYGEKGPPPKPPKTRTDP